MKKHSWTDTHFVLQAKGCKNRKVDTAKLKNMPWLKGTCNVCINRVGKKHAHLDSPLKLTHESCIKQSQSGHQGLSSLITE